MLRGYFTNYQSPSYMYKKLRKAEGTRNEHRVYLIKLMPDKMKKVIENVPEKKTLKIE